MFRREWLLVGFLLGSALGVQAQGITAVTRRTFMGGVIGGGLGAGGVGGGGGGVGGAMAVSPQVSAAAAALQPAAPLLSGPSFANPTVAPAARPPESPEARAARESAAQAAVLAFQQEQARKGLPSAQLALGRRHLTGDGVERNPALARVWLEAAERNGMTEARKLLAGIPADAGARPVARVVAAP